MRRFFALAMVLLFALPFGVAISGCSKATAVTYCNANANSGPVLGQTVRLDLGPRLTGISLNEGQIGNIGRPSPTDCRGTATSVSSFFYGSTDITLVDVSPADGRICAGVWNRNTGGNIADYTFCTPNNRQGTAFVTASAQGVTSNPLPVYVHPIVTSIVLGPASTNCALDPASNCAFDATKPNGCGAATAFTAYDGNSCISQGKSAQLAGRAFQGADITNPANNISCLVGPLTFSAQDPSVVTIDQNGLATARQPGASTINAAITQSSSSAGFFSTCPPKTITLNAAGRTTVPGVPLTVNQNVTQPLVATVTDTNGLPLTNIQLEYVSTNPTAIPAGGGTVTPTFPGAGAIIAICQPPTCNSAPQNAIGLFGNGTPVTSNPLDIMANGSNTATVLYVGSTQSQYIQPVDLGSNTQSAPVRLPYAPNSMVISTDLSTIYMGTPNEIMIFSTAGNQLTQEDTLVAGTVLAVSPDSQTVVISDPVRKLTYLYNPPKKANTSGSIVAQYGGVGTRAQWSPDSLTVYIALANGDNRLLVYSTFNGFNAVPLGNPATDVAITVPSAGVYLGGMPVTAHTNCPQTTPIGSGLGQQTSNVFYPQVPLATSANADRIAATNDGVHILGAAVAGDIFSDIGTNRVSGGCPVAFTTANVKTLPLAGITPTAITNVLPTSDSSFAFVTYQGTGGVVPQYAPATQSLSDIALQTTANGVPVAPVNGVVSTDNQTFFVGTSGDKVVHRLTRGASGFSDTLPPINPMLPGLTGPRATPDLLVQRPRKSNA